MILIAGPCVIEDYENLQRTAEYIQEATRNKRINVYFKASCLKDNRTTIDNYQGVGFEKGIKLLQRIKNETGLKTTTDFHSSDQLRDYSGWVDLIQIPAYLAQQTSILKTASLQRRDIHIKKPQFLGPEGANKLTQKLKDLDFPGKVFLTDRGTMFGYNQVMMDPRHISLMKADKVLADITHPNKNFPGMRWMNVEALGMSAIAAGADGIFLETASNCSEALCDAGTMLSPSRFNTVINKIYNLWEYLNDK